MLERIAAQEASGRLLLVNTTNIDLGDMRAWDVVAEAKAALAAGEPERVHRILLASAGIPAIFPARRSAQTSSSTARSPATFCTARAIDEERQPGRAVAREARRAPLPRVRYWVIFNNQFRFPPQVTAPRWPDIMSRATIMATQSATVSAMRHLQANAELTRIKSQSTWSCASWPSPTTGSRRCRAPSRRK